MLKERENHKGTKNTKVKKIFVPFVSLWFSSLLFMRYFNGVVST